jgi:hypothetical protein
MGVEAHSHRIDEFGHTRAAFQRGGTKTHDSSLTTGSYKGYELHALPQKETSISPTEAGTDDGGCEFTSFVDSSHPNLKTDMSRTPLLVRSSPALGTGSYGGLPVLSLSSSPDEPDENQVTSFLQRKKKGKSRLRYSESTRRSSLLDQSNADSSRSEPLFTTSRPRRRSNLDEASSSHLDGAFEDQEGSHFESRFSNGLDSSAVGIEDDEEFDSNSLHDIKVSGQPLDDSPYAQVRASVAPTDDLSLSINTPRMWTLSIFFAILGSSTNLFFSLRYPSVSITPIIALLLVHPLGLLWDQIFKRSDDPDETFINGALQSRRVSISHDENRPSSRHSAHLQSSRQSWIKRSRLWLAQGQWNAKEHCCVYISSNVSFGFAFATDVSNTATRVVLR